MTKQTFLSYCLAELGTTADYPFENDLETAVLRHEGTRKWYALVMRLKRSKLGQANEAYTDVVNLKLPKELIGSFSRSDAVYPAYHMNKEHWISLLLEDAEDELIRFLTAVSFKATDAPLKKPTPRKQKVDE